MGEVCGIGEEDHEMPCSSNWFTISTASSTLFDIYAYSDAWGE